MRYKVQLNDPGESSVMAEVVEVEADEPPDTKSDPDFVIFLREHVRVGLFRRERVQAIYESGRGKPPIG